MFQPGDESSFFSYLTLWQAITSPPWRVREIFSCYLRPRLYSLVRGRSIITDEGGLS